MKSPIIYLFLQCYKSCWLSFTYHSLFISYLWILSSCSWNKIVIFFKHNCSLNTLPIYLKCEILNLNNSINIYTDIYNLVPFVLSRRKYEFNEWWSIVFISLCFAVIISILLNLDTVWFFEQFYEKSGYDIMAQDDTSNAKSVQNMKDILKIAQNGKLWFKWVSSCTKTISRIKS